MSEVVPRYLDNAAREPLGSPGRGQFQPPYPMNAVAFLRPFLEVSVVPILSCSEVDPCARGVGWSGEVVNVPSAPLCEPGL